MDVKNASLKVCMNYEDPIQLTSSSSSCFLLEAFFFLWLKQAQNTWLAKMNTATRYQKKKTRRRWTMLLFASGLHPFLSSFSLLSTESLSFKPRTVAATTYHVQGHVGWIMIHDQFTIKLISPSQHCLCYHTYGGTSQLTIFISNESNLTNLKSLEYLTK